ncbi:MAG: DUF434 domain-containing protein [Candidatus Hodarchaeota archaeon]
MLNLNIETNKRLIDAYCDLIFLLDRKYPKKSALTFVANRYNLENKFRSILNRAALSLEEVQTIQSHLIGNSNQFKEKDLYIDTYNQIITFFSFIKKDPLIICRDGVLRDIFSSIHIKKDLKVERELILPYLRSLTQANPKHLYFYFDSQISHSNNHANLFRILLSELNIEGVCEVHQAVDWVLKNKTEGVVLSHDSTILLIAPHCFDFLSWFLNLKYPHAFSQQLSFDFSKVSCF